MGKMTKKSSSSFDDTPLDVLLVEEATPPTEGNPIRWLLLTTLPIDTFEQAWQCVHWYSLRWRIVGEAFPQGTLSFHTQKRLSNRTPATGNGTALTQGASDLLYRCLAVNGANLYC
jgi:hypothetical protein